MCGIIAIVSLKNVVPKLIEGLKRLEYRGYDSAGLAVMNSEIQRLRSTGRVATMELALDANPLQGNIGIGHTRWATHGGVTEPNAHPHISQNDIALVHNGIIENHEDQRERLRALGYHFDSQTDTEVIAHLIHHYFDNSGDLLEATKRTVRELKGSYSIAVISRRNPEKLICAQNGCPLLIGLGDEENYVASDVSAILSSTRSVIYLEPGEIAEISHKGSQIFDRGNRVVKRQSIESDVSLAPLDLGPYNHYMQKEIHEQPQALSDTIQPILEAGFSPTLFGPEASWLAEIDAVQILACGTSYYAGLVARQWIESIAHVPCAVEIASEYRYRDSVPNPRQLILTISQSGETLDTLEALKHASNLGQQLTLSLCNVRSSAIPRASKITFYTRAGAEIGVASTKAFTTQLAALFALAATLAKLKKRLSPEQEKEHFNALRAIPGQVQQVLNLEPQVAAWAERIKHKHHAIFLGRGVHSPIAKEGALKLKEISYIHAEAFHAGELKHGPLALVDEKMPVFVTAPNDNLLEKVKSNMQEVRARGGELYILADQDSVLNSGDNTHIIRMLPYIGILSPILYAIPMQLLAYHAGLLKGADVDKPRNLAKSVTVE